MLCSKTLSVRVVVTSARLHSSTAAVQQTHPGHWATHTKQQRTARTEAVMPHTGTSISRGGQHTRRRSVRQGANTHATRLRQVRVLLSRRRSMFIHRCPRWHASCTPQAAGAARATMQLGLQAISKPRVSARQVARARAGSAARRAGHPLHARPQLEPQAKTPPRRHTPNTSAASALPRWRLQAMRGCSGRRLCHTPKWPIAAAPEACKRVRCVRYPHPCVIHCSKSSYANPQTQHGHTHTHHTCDLLEHIGTTPCRCGAGWPARNLLTTLSSGSAAAGTRARHAPHPHHPCSISAVVGASATHNACHAMDDSIERMHLCVRRAQTYA
jgi:hypothetical protein